MNEKRDKVNIDDIIGLIKTDEPINGVEEVRKLRGRETEKRLFVGRKTCEDRFTIIADYEGEIGVKENCSGDVLVLKHSDLNAQQFVAQLVVFLNDQNQAIVDLFDGSKYWLDKASEKIDELEKENEKLKSEIKLIEERADKVYDENKELKEQIRNLRKLANELYMEGSE